MVVDENLAGRGLTSSPARRANAEETTLTLVPVSAMSLPSCPLQVKGTSDILQPLRGGEGSGPEAAAAFAADEPDVEKSGDEEARAEEDAVVVEKQRGAKINPDVEEGCEVVQDSPMEEMRRAIGADGGGPDGAALRGTSVACCSTTGGLTYARLPLVAAVLCWARSPW